MTAQHSTHRIGAPWRWFLYLLTPPLIALMGWGLYEVISNYRAGDPDVGLGALVVAVTMLGGITLLFLYGLILAYRGDVRIDADRMVVRGVFTTIVVTPERITGFRIDNDQIYVYLRDRRFGLHLSYLDGQWKIEHWLRQHAEDVLETVLAEEDEAIARDTELGFTTEDKEARLRRLRVWVERSNWLTYLAAAAAVGNAIFLEHRSVETAAIATLVFVPLFLDLLALSNRGHIQVDHDEGSRYPQIFTATMTAGVTLFLLAAFERGALVDKRCFYEVLALAVVAKGLLWCLIDAPRLSRMRERGRGVLILTIAGMFAIPAAWVGGGLYFVNKHLDTSQAVWHVTRVIERKTASGKITTYELIVAPWSEDIREPLAIDVRRADYEAYAEGSAVRIAVRDGGIGVRRVSDLQRP